MRTIRASEIGTYLFCKRSWWYQIQGLDSENIAELASGSKLHHQHGRAVLFSSALRLLGYGFVLVALILLAIYLTNLIL
jgi:CRISPR/Cas system-associated exonuclease Cas4 (RecB family)